MKILQALNWTFNASPFIFEGTGASFLKLVCHRNQKVMPYLQIRNHLVSQYLVEKLVDQEL